RDCPIPLDRPRRDAEGCRRVFHRHSPEKPALYDLAATRIHLPQPLKDQVESRKSSGLLLGKRGYAFGEFGTLFERDLSQLAPSLLRLATASIVAQDMAHRLCREGKKVHAGFRHYLLLVDQLTVGFVDESGRTQCIVSVPATPLPVSQLKQ